MPLMDACTPSGICTVSSSNVDSMSDDQRTMPKRAAPAHAPRVSTSGVTAPSAATGAEKASSHEFTHRFENAAGGPYDVL